MPVHDTENDEARDLMLSSKCDCMTVHDNRGRVRVVTRTGISLGVLVSIEDHDRLKRSDADRMDVEQQGDGLDAARGIFWGVAVSLVVLVAVLIGVVALARRYERSVMAAELDARAVRTHVVPLD